MKVLERNRFQNEGIAEKAIFKNGKFGEEHRYALLNENLDEHIENKATRKTRKIKGNKRLERD